MTDNEYFEELNSDSKNTSIIFSHNINGETHPCGCRNFPLGGLPQVNGLLQSLKKTQSIIYVDSGDTFFSSTIVPEMLKESSTFAAYKIAESLDLLGLKFITPGDQDFALGEDFLVKVSNKHDFNFLISNSTKHMKIKHKKWGHIKSNGKDFFFLGIVSPDLLKSKFQHLFTSPVTALNEQIKLINSKFPNIKDKKFILLSHSGLDPDRNLAKKLPYFDWIIGAHSQSYLRFSEDVGRTQLVQVLSRNHYLGDINFPHNLEKKVSYTIHETRDETKDLIKPNKMTSWLNDYKSAFDKILISEQRLDTVDDSEVKHPTYLSCSECHTKQVEFWQETSHSVAYTTLIKAKSANNPSCVGCHSLGFRSPKGFSHTQNIVQSDEKDFNSKQYWEEFNPKHMPKKSVRNLSKAQRKMVSSKWIALDTKSKVSHNFANVQCLHCHAQTGEHPFDSSQGSTIKDIKTSCVNCHTKDQSPEWYLKDSKGLATSVNKKYFSQKLKEVSCPKIER
jgi:hypothetical protein